MRFSWRRLVIAVTFVASFLLLFRCLTSVSTNIVLSRPHLMGSRGYQQPLHAPNAKKAADEASETGPVIQQRPTSVLQTPSEFSHYGEAVPNIAPHLMFEMSQPSNSGEATDADPSLSNPPKTDYTKAVVMGKLASEDTEWVHTMLPDWQSAIYVVDLPPNTTSSPTGLRTPLNRAKEAMPYLTYILDHYPSFPDVVAFVHAHRKGYPQAWHTDAIDHDAVRMLRSLVLPFVVETGYVNLRCLADPGCPAEIAPFRDPPRPAKHAEQVFASVYASFFNASLASVRAHLPLVATPCCAQFAVSREQILRRPREAYARYRDYLIATASSSSSSSSSSSDLLASVVAAGKPLPENVQDSLFDDETMGTVMEYMWHMIFGRDAVHCPHPRTCRCDVFGRCARGGRRGPRTGGRRPKTGGRRPWDVGRGAR